jgi:hypothetical protein
MNKSIVSLIFSFSLLSSMAHAEFFAIEEFNCVGPECGAAPIYSASDFTFKAAAASFALSKPVLIEQIVGNWIQVAGAQSTDVFGVSTKMGYNPQGIRTENGILTLTFSKTAGGFLGGVVTKKENVIISNLGPTPQGPFDLNFSGTGSACVATNAYATHPEYGSGYFAYECRALDASKLLCALRFMNNGARNTPNRQLIYDGNIIIYFGFARE